MFSLGETLGGRVVLSGNDRGDGQGPVTSPESIAEHIRSHGVCFAEAAVGTLLFRAFVEDTIPIEYESTNGLEALR